MFKDQINNLLDQQIELEEVIKSAGETLVSAGNKLKLIKKGIKELEKLQDQLDGQTTVSDE